MPVDAPPDDLPDPLRRLGESLLEAATVLRAIDGPEPDRSERERLAGTLDAIRQGLPAAVEGLRDRVPTPGALSTWRHDLRDSATVILGRAHLLAHDPRKHARAVAQIELAATSLRERLGRPPG